MESFSFILPFWIVGWILVLILFKASGRIHTLIHSYQSFIFWHFIIENILYNVFCAFSSLPKSSLMLITSLLIESLFFFSIIIVFFLLLLTRFLYCFGAHSDTRLTLTNRDLCVCLASAVIKGMHNYCTAFLSFIEKETNQKKNQNKQFSPIHCPCKRVPEKRSPQRGKWTHNSTTFPLSWFCVCQSPGHTSHKEEWLRYPVRIYWEYSSFSFKKHLQMCPWLAIEPCFHFPFSKTEPLCWVNHYIYLWAWLQYLYIQVFISHVICGIHCFLYSPWHTHQMLPGSVTFPISLHNVLGLARSPRPTFTDTTNSRMVWCQILVRIPSSIAIDTHTHMGDEGSYVMFPP